MSPNVLMFGWNYPVPGREKLSAGQFPEFVEFLRTCQKNGEIESFEAVFLDAHGGDLNAFFLIRGEPARLQAFADGEAFTRHIIRAQTHLSNVGVVRGYTGEAVQQRMALWESLIPT